MITNEFIKSIENNILKMNDNHKNAIRNQSIPIIKEVILRKQKMEMISKWTILTKKFLKDYPDIYSS